MERKDISNERTGLDIRTTQRAIKKYTNDINQPGPHLTLSLAICHIGHPISSLQIGCAAAQKQLFSLHQGPHIEWMGSPASVAHSYANLRMGTGSVRPDSVMIYLLYWGLDIGAL
jgi:hypothetical protein